MEKFVNVSVCLSSVCVAYFGDCGLWVLCVVVVERWWSRGQFALEVSFFLWPSSFLGLFLSLAKFLLLSLFL